MESEVFTPMNEDRTMRLNFPRSEVNVIEGELGQRGVGLKAIVEILGKRYCVYGAPCDIPTCQCDAFIKPI